MKTLWKKRVAGFTLLEILVVVAIVGILTAVVIGNLGGSSASARDTKRQGDLRNLQSAIETYKNEHSAGLYPEGCNGPNVWSGQVGSSEACGNGTNQYILGLAPEYIPVMPADPRPVTGMTGYMYTVNTERTVYKIIAMNVVETETITYSHPLKSCDIRPAPGTGGLQNLGPNGVNTSGLNNLMVPGVALLHKPLVEPSLHGHAIQQQ